MEWKLSRKWAQRKVACAMPYILRTCGGQCCRTRAFWPPSSGDENGCSMLGPRGCTLGADRPVVCQVYPLKLNKNGTLVGYHRAKSVSCGKAWGLPEGPTLFEAMRPNFVNLFGAAQVRAAEAAMAAGKDPVFYVPPRIAAAYEKEKREEAANAPPTGISGKRYPWASA